MWKRKTVAAPPLIGGMKESEFDHLIERLSGERPSLIFWLNRLDRSARIERGSYRLVETEDGPAKNYADSGAIRFNADLKGRIGSPEIRAEGQLEVGSTSMLRSGRLGSVSFETRTRSDEEASAYTLAEFSLYLQSEGYMLELCRMFEAGLLSKNSVGMTLWLEAEIDVETWSRSFLEKGYGPHLQVIDISFGTRIGKPVPDFERFF
jgi:hypothetical protein